MKMIMQVPTASAPADSPANYLEFVKKSWLEEIAKYNEEFTQYANMRDDCTIRMFKRQKMTSSLFLILVFIGIAGFIGMFIWFAIEGFDDTLIRWMLIPIVVIVGGLLGFQLNYKNVENCIEWMKVPQPRNPCFDADFPRDLLPNECKIDPKDIK